MADSADDRAQAVRDEDAFDVAAVHRWLQGRADVPAELPTVRQFSGGSSNLTYRLDYPDLSLLLRRPPSGQKAKSAHDMRREYRVQAALAPTYPYVPAMVGFCEDEGLIGSDFYVMELVQGLVLGKRLPDGLTLDETQARALGDRLARRWCCGRCPRQAEPGLGHVKRSAA